MGQAEYFFDVPGTRGLLAMGQITHDSSLGRRQIHLLQGSGDGLGGAGMEHTEQGTVIGLQRNHLQYVSQATFILT